MVRISRIKYIKEHRKTIENTRNFFNGDLQIYLLEAKASNGIENVDKSIVDADPTFKKIYSDGIKAKKMLKVINDSLDLLPKEDAKMIKLRYFEKYTLSALANKFHVCDRTMDYKIQLALLEFVSVLPIQEIANGVSNPIDLRDTKEYENPYTKIDPKLKSIIANNKTTPIKSVWLD